MICPVCNKRPSKIHKLKHPLFERDRYVCDCIMQKIADAWKPENLPRLISGAEA